MNRFPDFCSVSEDRPTKSRLVRASVVLLATAALALTTGTPSAASEIEVTRAADGTLMLISKPKPAGYGYVGSLPARWPYQSLIHHYARQNGLQPKLVAAVIQTESAFRSNALSNKGAQGLMQLMPSTARELGVRDVWDPAENIRGGTVYLKRMLDRFGSLELALAGYNAGPSAVEKYGRVPPYEETTHYVDKVLRLYRGTGSRSSIVRASTAQQKAVDNANGTGAKGPGSKAAEVGSEPPRPMRPVHVTRDAEQGIVLMTRN
jgi:hypothetical protein